MAGIVERSSRWKRGVIGVEPIRVEKRKMKEVRHRDSDEEDGELKSDG